MWCDMKYGNIFPEFKEYMLKNTKNALVFRKNLTLGMYSNI